MQLDPLADVQQCDPTVLLFFHTERLQTVGLKQLLIQLVQLILRDPDSIIFHQDDQPLLRRISGQADDPSPSLHSSPWITEFSTIGCMIRFGT